MSNDDVLVGHLRDLAKRDSWRIPELPPSITEDVLRVLDARGWIEFAVWRLASVRQNTGLFPDGFEPRRDESIGWFSPLMGVLFYRHQSGFAWSNPEQSKQDLTLTSILAEGRRRPREAAEVRVSERGRAILAEWMIDSPTPSRRQMMTDGEKRVWNALKGRALTGAELVRLLKSEQGFDTSEETIRQHVADLRKSGYSIETKRGRGYWRPDAPPTESIS